MAYEVTATKRRPKTFDEMAGQEFVVATLKRSIETGRIAHAYLFSGPRGCGKTSAARILARSLNCEKGPTVRPCGACPACLEIARGTGLDVIEIDGASNTGVNDVRQIKDEVLFPPNAGRFKVYIIDEVHMLSNSAFNALLKTIEEPPPYIVFIFATTELHKVPATIKSRCQQFNFRLFSVETIKDLLSAACAEAGIEAEEEALFWIAKEATGSMRDAYTLLDQVIAFSDGKLETEAIRDKLGLVGLDSVNELAEACSAGSAERAFEIVDRVLDRGVSIDRFVVDMAEYYRSLLLLKHGIQRESLLGYAPDRFSKTVLETYSAVHLERAASLFLDLYRDIRFSVSPRFELETAVSRLCWLGSWVSPVELRAAIDGVRGRLLNGSNTARWGPPEKDVFEEKKFELPDSSPNHVSASGGPAGGLTEGFKRFMAERENRVVPAPVSVPAEESTPVRAAEEHNDDFVDQDEDSPAGNQSTDLAALKRKTIEMLKKERGMLASGLEKTGDWYFIGDSIAIPISDKLTGELLRKDQQLITSALRNSGGSFSSTEIIERIVPETNISEKDKAAIPLQVETVRRLFKGTIVRQPTPSN